MASKNLGEQVAKTYKMLRLGLALMAFGLPILLWIGGHLLGHLPLAGSISAYYHASDPQGPPGQGVMRNEFVGVLFGVSVLLLVYQGFTKLEDWALNLAGILAIGIAVFPMPWPEAESGVFTVHGICAVLFFVAIAYVCIFRAGDTLPLIKNERTRKRYLRIYHYLGVGMATLPVVAWALLSTVPDYKSVTFVVELLGIYVFATYWVVKSREASSTDVDRKAARGQVRTRPHGLSDALRPVPVTMHEAD
jgi:hypothetical protein